MAAILTAPIPSGRFSYDPDTQVFVAEASDLGEYLHRLYDDACDVGFRMQSARTGRIVTLALSHTEVDDRENEVLWWTFEPVDADGCPWTVTVYND